MPWCERSGCIETIEEEVSVNLKSNSDVSSGTSQRGPYEVGELVALGDMLD